MSISSGETMPPRAWTLVVLLHAGASAEAVPDRLPPTLSTLEFPTAEAELRQNIDEHDRKCSAICKVEGFYCGPVDSVAPAAMAKYPTATPSIDYPGSFAPDGEEASIYITKEPLFTPAECEDLIALAEAEGGGLPSAKSGKFSVGQAWIKDMPGVRDKFNGWLRRQLFPQVAALFPRVVSSGALLRAHSVLVLKYNASNPRSDLHVDDALLAFTVALSPSTAYQGGGTYFEELQEVSGPRVELVCERARSLSRVRAAARRSASRGNERGRLTERRRRHECSFVVCHRLSTWSRAT